MCQDEGAHSPQEDMKACYWSWPRTPGMAPELRDLNRRGRGEVRV